MTFGPDDVLLLVDVQLDFLPGGALAVPDGDAVLAPIALLLERAPHVVVTQDWHPPGHTERGLRRLVLAGLARDYCVRLTEADALSLGYEVTVAEEACRGIGPAA